MKKIVLLLLLLLFVSLIAHAQSPYAVENLKKASVEELNTYYAKALKQQQTGRTLNIVGCSVFGGSTLGVLIFGPSMGMAAIFFVFPLAAGVLTLAVGLPMNLSGKARVERIDAIRNSTFNNLQLDLLPTNQYNFITRSYQPAVTFRIRF